jgi:uncharacterized protein YegL
MDAQAPEPTRQNIFGIAKLLASNSIASRNIVVPTAFPSLSTHTLWTRGEEVMSKALRIVTPFTLLVLFLIIGAVGQSPQHKKKQQAPLPTPAALSEPTPPAEPDPKKDPQDIDTIKTDTDLVTVPVVATDQNGTYVADLQKEEFVLSEDGVKQELAFFGTVATPFHVVLLLDTSGSTEKKLGQIQEAASAFVDQLRSNDRVKVISFDDQVRELIDFTNNREAVKSAIRQTRSGSGTKVYDAMELALDSIRRLKGRKAFVIFTDGVDWHSDHATYQSNIRWLDEEGVIVYPIRYETRAETERIARQQSQEMSPDLPTLAGIHRPAPGTTAPTFPSTDPDSVPTSGSQPKSGPLGLPLPAEILRGRRQGTPPDDRDRVPTDTSLPPNSRTLPPEGTIRRDPRGGGRDDSISSMLDLAYSTADAYLRALAEKTGGTLLRADTLTSLPTAFAKIAAELRTQYVLGYYPINKDKDERYRKIKVTSTRKSVVVRARPGYTATSGR